MAVVATMTTSKGVKVDIMDDAYAGKSEAELEKVRREARRIAWGILRRAAERGEPI